MYEMEKMLAKMGFLSLWWGAFLSFSWCDGIAIDLHLDSTLDQILVYFSFLALYPSQKEA